MKEREIPLEEERMCPLVRDVFVLYRDGALSEESEAWTREHLSHCQRCAKYYRMMKKNCRSEESAGLEEKAKENAALSAENRYEQLARRLRRERRRRALFGSLAVTAALAGSMAFVYTAVKRQEKE